MASVERCYFDPFYNDGFLKANRVYFLASLFDLIGSVSVKLLFLFFYIGSNFTKILQHVRNHGFGRS